MEATWWTQPDQLDESQQAVVALPLDGNHVVIGPPGSGKTNLLVLRATFLNRADKHDTLVLTFGRVLREFLATGTQNYPFSNDKIQTYFSWASNVLRQNGVSVDTTGEFEEVREKLLTGLKELTVNGCIENIYDCILIDEVQDYSGEEIEVIRQFAKSFFAVGDDRQRIYKANGALAALKDTCQVSELKYHYRNGIQICRAADGIYDLVDCRRQKSPFVDSH